LMIILRLENSIWKELGKEEWSLEGDKESFLKIWLLKSIRSNVVIFQVQRKKWTMMRT